MELELIESLLFATIRSGTPLLLCALGILISEKSGVLNLGQEGMILMGAVIAFVVSFSTKNNLFGLFAGICAGCVLSMCFATIALSLRANQVATGLALTIFGTGLSAFIASDYLGETIPSIDTLNIPLLTAIPLIGKPLFGQDLLVYLSLLIFILIWYVCYHSRIGLILRAVGENPQSAHKLGLPVLKVRYLALLAGGSLAGLSGAYLSLSYTPVLTDGMSAGRGWIALALVVFASWRLGRLIFGAYLFGMMGILNLLMQSIGWNISTNILAMLPYIMTILVLVMLSLRGRSDRQNSEKFTPRSLGQIYHPEK